MNDQFSNRLTAFTTALTFANEAEWKPVWENKTPKLFGTKMAAAATAVDGLMEWAQEQSGSIAGFTEQKDVSETALENAAFTLAQAVATYFMDLGSLGEAEPFRRSISYWQLLRDNDLLLRTQELLEAATPLTSGSGAAQIAEDYGISAARVTALQTKRTAYEALVNMPAAARAQKKGYTDLMRDQIRPVTELFRGLDRLVVQFREETNGEQFVAGWFAARSVVDSGHGPGTGSGGGGGGTPDTAPAKPTVTVDGLSSPTQVGHAVSAGATSFRWLLQKTGESDYSIIGEGPENFIEMTGLVDVNNFLKAIGINSIGESPESDPVQFAGGE